MMIKDLQKVQSKLENNFLALQPDIEKNALNLIVKNKKEAVEYLTNCSYQSTDLMFKEWKNLMYYLFTKYNDGYVKNEKGEPEQVPYNDKYYRDVLLNRNSARLPVWSYEQNKEPNTF